MKLNLPVVKKDVTYAVPHFPTVMQAVIFRCWEMVPAEKIAKVLKTTTENVIELAFGMGLKEQKNLEEWMYKGYISIIRNVWQLLPYSQILELLDWDEERLNYVLKEDDFFNVKLGLFKFDCPEVLYRPLTDEEKAATLLVKEAIETNISGIAETAIPFKFYEKSYKPLSSGRIQSGVEITKEWSIKNNTGKQLQCIDDFADEFLSHYDIGFYGKGDKNIVIYCDIQNDDDEYHEIYIDENIIEIHAAKEDGVLRALYYLLQLAEDNGKPEFEKRVYKRKTAIKTRYIYSFSGLYGDVLDVDNIVSFPDDLLKEYAKNGINGVWIQAVLYKLQPFVFDESISTGWEKRLRNLNNLIERAKRYGIKVYLYINEPRGMPYSFFDKISYLKGSVYHDGLACLCTSNDEVKKYLENTLFSLCKAVPGLGGFFNISMSENLTHCYSRSDIAEENMCPVCKNIKKEKITSDVITLMANTVHKADPDMKFFVYTWAWERVFDAKQVENLIKSLPKNVILLNVSENWMEYEIGGIKGNVIDYTLSMPGPSKWSKEAWRIAKENGLETGAKVQINNSWECSTAPFLPVYTTVMKHIRNLKNENVSHMMLSWTLGGYPSDNIKIASSVFFEDENSEEDAYSVVLKNSYGAYAGTVKKAAEYFSDAFSEFPFSCNSLYYGPQNLGSANLLHEKPSKLTATMTCYPYDDVDTWRDKYPYDVFENQYKKLCLKWEQGLELIKDMPACEFSDMALYGYTFFKSSYNQLKFNRIREDESKKSECAEIIKDELHLAETAYEIMCRNSSVGYEAANHYYVNKTMLAEKIVQCYRLLKNL